MPQNYRIEHHIEKNATKHGNVSVEIERTPPKSPTFVIQHVYVPLEHGLCLFAYDTKQY